MEHKVIKLEENLYNIPVTLPAHGLYGPMICYLIRGLKNEKNLLIDTGSFKREHRGEFLDLLDLLALTPENTDIFLTHNHSDHAGNLRELIEMGYHVIMGRTCFEHEYASFLPSESRLRAEGFAHIPAGVQYTGSTLGCDFSGLEVETVGDGDKLSYGGFEFECIMTPGHSCGHMSLYDAATKTMILGDLVLFHIFTCVSCSTGVEDSLGDYFRSLETVLSYEVELALPGHGPAGSGTELKQRIRETYDFFDKELSEVESIITQNPGIIGAEIMDRVCRRENSIKLEDATSGLMYFLIHKTMAYLDYLVRRGRVISEEKKGVKNYYPAAQI